VTADAEEDSRTQGPFVKGRFPMATRKRKPHNLGTSAGGQVSDAVRQRRSGRAGVLGATSERSANGRKKAPAVKPRYSMLIRWSDEDDVYIVTLPEFDHAKTHGETYEEAARQGTDLIDPS
jgi:hypothetical protein